jgi:ankyrin repeat protein
MMKQSHTDKQMLECLASGRFAMAKHLLESGADADACDFNGNSAIHLAARKSNLEMIAALIGAGANINVRDSFGMTALDIAARSKSHFIVRKLATA